MRHHCTTCHTALGLFVLLLSVALFANEVRADDEVEEPAVLVNKTVIAPGLVYMTHRHTKTIRDYSRLSNLVRSYPSTILVHSFRLNPKRFGIRVLDAADYAPPRCPIQRLVEASGALGGVNAGFFDERSRPLGLHILRSKVRRSFSMGGKQSAAIFYERDGAYNIINNKNYRTFFVDTRPPTPMTEAVQSYPLLVGNGRSCWQWRPGEGIAARTAVGVTWGGNVILTVTDTDPLNGMSLSELATFMAEAHRCKVALNLDGGTSSQMYYHDENHTLTIEGRETIRTALAIFPVGSEPKPPIKR